MTDCPNIEMRELLPDYLHDALTASERARVEAHLASCADCASELEVLQEARLVMSARRIPSINAASIVAALPRPLPSRATRPALKRSTMLYRMAAVVSFVSLGGISVAVARSYLGNTPSVSVDSSAGPSDGSPTVAGATGSRADTPNVAPAADRLLAVHPSISDLDDAELESLLGELDTMEASPLAEPETTPGGRAVASSTIGS